jgi:hypothetical protein
LTPRLRRRLIRLICYVIGYCSIAGVAFGDPISAFLLGAIGIEAGTTAFAIGTFIINTVISTFVSALINKLFGPNNKQQPRQASITSLEIGEVPREALLGRSGQGGSLALAFNYGGDYGTDWEVLVIPVADHLCDALEGYWVNDAYIVYAADGAVAGYNGQLEVYWRNGAMDQTFPAALAAHSTFDGDDNLAGVAHVWVAYKADKPGAKHPVWPGGRPHFIWQLRGKRCYDPRLDDTVDGGAGAHRWDDPTTWEWSENAAICRYNWVRGVYAGDQVGDPSMLLVGRGLTAIEAPPERVIAAANVCDEDVALAAGGTQKRYKVGGVVRADERYIDTEEMWAACMAGVITQPQGGVEILPGIARSPVFAITDADLVAGAPVEFNGFKPDTDRINSVIPRYIAPDQKWSDHAAPIRRDTDDVTADGGPREQTLTLALVTDVYQAQRCGEIARRQARMERSGKVTLGPRFAGIEEGDWGTWTSARHTGGVAMTVQVTSYGLGPDWRNTLSLQETAASVFDWATMDEIVPGSALPPPPADWPLIAPPIDFAAVAAVRSSTDLSSFPVIAVSAAAAIDGRVVVEEVERAPAGTDVDSADWISAIGYLPTYHPDGDLLGVLAGQSYDVRARNRTADNWVSIWVYVTNVLIPIGSSLGSGGYGAGSGGGGDGTFPLDPPTDLAAVSPGPPDVTVTWKNPLAVVFDHVRVWRGATNVFADAADISGPIAGTWGSAGEYDDAPGDGTWYYWVVAHDAAEAQTASAGPVSVDVASALAPTGLAVTWAPGGDPILAWTNSAAPALDHLRVFRGATDVFGAAADVSGSLAAATVTYDDAAAASDGTVYYWWVVGYDAAESASGQAGSVAGLRYDGFAGSGAGGNGAVIASTHLDVSLPNVPGVWNAAETFTGAVVHPGFVGDPDVITCIRWNVWLGPTGSPFDTAMATDDINYVGGHGAAGDTQPNGAFLAPFASPYQGMTVRITAQLDVSANYQPGTGLTGDGSGTNGSATADLTWVQS